MPIVGHTQHTTRTAPGPVNTLAAFRANPTGAARGAEIQGVDFTLTLPEDVP